MNFKATFVVAGILAACPLNFFAFAQTATAQVAGKGLVTTARNTLGTETNRSASVRLGDVDGDGDLDVVVANGRHWPQQNYLFLNQGRGKFLVIRPLGSDRAKQNSLQTFSLISNFLVRQIAL